MERTPINPYGFEEHKLAVDANQKAVDRMLEYQTDTRQRVDTLIKAIFVLSGGALTISIGIFLRSGAPSLSLTQIQLLQVSWLLIFYSLAASSCVIFIMICQGYIFTTLWEKSFNAEDNKIEPGRWDPMLRLANWILGVTGFLAFLFGLALLACVAVTSLPHNSAGA